MMTFAQKNKLDITVIMPALNEEKNILFVVKNTLNAFENFKISGEVIVVNDGSTDKTEELAKSMTENDNRVRLINHRCPLGIGASFWDGIDNAKGEAIVLLPGDNENEPREIIRYYKLLDDVDFVVPFVYNKEVRSVLRNVLSYIYRFIINTTFLVNFNYTNGTVLYRKSILKELDYRDKSFFFQTDILIRLVKIGYLFAEVPYRLRPKSKEKSKALTFKSFFQLLKGYLGLVKDIYFTCKEDFAGRLKEGTQSAIRYKDA